MKQKVFTLLTLLVLCVTGAWAEDITVTWLKSDGMAATPSTAGIASVNDVLTVSNLTKSADISADIVRRSYTESDVAKYYADFIPDTKVGTNKYYSKDDYITFSATVKSGFTFTPTSVTAYAKGRGTGNNGAKIFATLQTSNGSAAINNSNSTPTALSLNSFYKDTYESGETITFYIHIGSNADDGSVRKGVVLRDVILTGTYSVADTRDPLTLSFTPDNQNIAVGGNLATSLNWSEDTSSESAKYTTTYSSSDEAIATVNPSGVITGVAAGTTTITATVTATGDATYKTSKATITVFVIAPKAKDANMVVPASTLDLTNAATSSTMLNGTWHADYGRALFGNDGDNNYLVYSLIGAYQSTGSQTWIGKYGLGSSNESWSSTGVFKGGSAYMTTSKRANLQTTDVLSFRIKGVSKIQVLADTRGTSRYLYLAAYEMTGNDPAATTIVYNSLATASGVLGTLTLNLDDTKEYTVELTSPDNASRLYEMALFYDESVQLYEPIATASGKNYATYVTTNALDFSTVSDDIKAYVAASDPDEGKITFTGKDAVPAKTPILVKTTSAGATVNVPVATSAPDAVGKNNLVAGTGAAISYDADESHFYYILTNGRFKPANNSVVAVGKAYLSLEAAAAANELTISFDDEDGGVTGIQNLTPALSKGEGAVFDLQGRRVAQPTKGLYIVNGKKVVLK